MVSPPLAKVYLHGFARQWQTYGTGILMRYADDSIEMCRTYEEPKRPSGRCGTSGSGSASG